MERRGAARWLHATVGMSSVVSRIGGPVIGSIALTMPAMWPTEPPALTPKLRSVRRYNGCRDRSSRALRPVPDSRSRSLTIASTRRRSAGTRSGSTANCPIHLASCPAAITCRRPRVSSIHTRPRVTSRSASASGSGRPADSSPCTSIRDSRCRRTWVSSRPDLIHPTNSSKPTTSSSPAGCGSGNPLRATVRRPLTPAPRRTSAARAPGCGTSARPFFRC